eukprot:COSAG01_NODE_927_length_12693_cov_16.333810_10_plen_365_part_00
MLELIVLTLQLIFLPLTVLDARREWINRGLWAGFLGHTMGQALPQLLIFGAVLLRIFGMRYTYDVNMCNWELRLLVAANLIGWLKLADFLTLHKTIGPFFIVVAQILRRDVVSFLVLMAFIIPAFAVAFNVVMASVPSMAVYDSHTLQGEAGELPIESAIRTHETVTRSALSLILATVGFGDVSMFGGVGAWDHVIGVTTLTIAFVLMMPIVTMNLLIAMMSDTYTDMRANSFSEWCLVSTQYVLSRESIAKMTVCQKLFRIQKPIHVPKNAHDYDLDIGGVSACPTQNKPMGALVFREHLTDFFHERSITPTDVLKRLQSVDGGLDARLGYLEDELRSINHGLDARLGFLEKKIDTLLEASKH